MTQRIITQDNLVVIQNIDIRDVMDDVKLAAEIGKYLVEQFPFWTWYVDIPPNQNWVTIKNLSVDGKCKWGWGITKTEFYGSPDVWKKKILLAAGEVLERFGVNPTRRPDPVDPLRPFLVKPEI